MVEHGHQVRFALPSPADEHQGAPTTGADALKGLEHVARGVGDVEERRRRDLGGAGVVLVGQLDGRAFEATTAELFAQGQIEHRVFLAACRCS